MEPIEADQCFEKKPHTVLVLCLVTGAAALFSWLACYAITGVLQHNGVAVYSPEHDPRLRWFLQSFFVLLASFGTLALLIHFWARQHLNSMDVPENE